MELSPVGCFTSLRDPHPPVVETTRRAVFRRTASPAQRGVASARRAMPGDALPGDAPPARLYGEFGWSRDFV